MLEKTTILKCYENEIMFFNSEINKLLEEISIKKGRINKRLRSKKNDITQLINMILSVLKCMAITKTYRLFLESEILPSVENNNLFAIKREQYFQELLITLLLKI